MTHFVVGIIIPKEEINRAESYIDEVMYPYSETLEVEPYIDKTKEEVEKEFLNFKMELKEKIAENKVSDYEEKYIENEQIKEISIKEWVKDWYGQDLDSKGNLLSTFNKKSFWDWYRIGGRWDGILTDNKQRSQDGFNFDDKHETIANNSIKVKELLKKYKEKQKAIKEFREAGKIISESLVGEEFFSDFGFGDIFREFFKTEELTKEQSKFYDKIKKSKRYFKKFKRNEKKYLSIL